MELTIFFLAIVGGLTVKVAYTLLHSRTIPAPVPIPVPVRRRQS